MAIHCIHCGTELPDSAQFCLTCGKSPRGASDASTQQPISWETCEIGLGGKKESFLDKFGNLGTFSCSFYATAIGPSGPYLAKASPMRVQGWVKRDGHHNWVKDDHKEVAACNALIQQLVADGWESTGRGLEWYNYKFRRKVR